MVAESQAPRNSRKTLPSDKPLQTMGHSAPSGPTEKHSVLRYDDDNLIQDADSSPSSSPLHFCSFSDDLEDNHSSQPQRRRKRRRRSNTVRTWLAYLMMGVTRRKHHDHDEEPLMHLDGESKGFVGSSSTTREGGFLSDSKTKSVLRSLRRKRKWYNYCVFGGISGLTILAILLALNLGLIVATSLYFPNPDPLLQSFGAPNTNTYGLDFYSSDFTKDVLPIPCHSHNDYWRKVPLFSALRAGCTGTEADVWLYSSELFVGHNRASLTANRTFQSLYIHPIVRLLEAANPHSNFNNGSANGVFDEEPTQSLILLVDVKTDGEATWPFVVAQLEPLRERGWLTFMQDGIVHNRAVTVVGTGNTPFDVLTRNSTYRDTFFDAPLERMWEPLPDSLIPTDDINEASLPTPPLAPIDSGQGMTGISSTSSFSQENSYYASVAYGKAVGRPWSGKVTDKQLKIIRGHVRGAHRRGLKVRYWNLPSWPVGVRNHVWSVLVREGVDVLNVDDLWGVGKVEW